jgi:hypothetical protein
MELSKDPDSLHVIDEANAPRGRLPTRAPTAKVIRAWNKVCSTIRKAVTPTSPEADGHFLGADNTVYPPNTPLSTILPFKANDVIPGAPPLIIVNGIDCAQREAFRLAEKAARQTKHPVIPIFNQTAGNLVKDIAKVFLNKLSIAPPPAVATVSALVVEAILSNKPLLIGGHSHGAMVVSSAVSSAKKQLIREHSMSIEQVETLMRKFLSIETYAGASTKYEDGPNYTHIVDEGDQVAWWLGVARHGLTADEISERSKRFESFNPKVSDQLAKAGQSSQGLIQPGAEATILRIPYDPDRAQKICHMLSHHLDFRARHATIPVTE